VLTFSLWFAFSAIVTRVQEAHDSESLVLFSCIKLVCLEFSIECIEVILGLGECSTFFSLYRLGFLRILLDFFFRFKLSCFLAYFGLGLFSLRLFTCGPDSFFDQIWKLITIFRVFLLDFLLGYKSFWFNHINFELLVALAEQIYLRFDFINTSLDRRVDSRSVNWCGNRIRVGFDSFHLGFRIGRAAYCNGSINRLVDLTLDTRLIRFRSIVSHTKVKGLLSLEQRWIIT